MREVPPPSSDLPALTRSVAACLASILELDTRDVPAPPAGHPEPWTVWRNWLSQRGLGLVPVLEPATFGWPGPWLALVAADHDDGLVGAVAFGVPPDLIWTPVSTATTFESVEAGFVIAPSDPMLWTPLKPGARRTSGRVEALALAAEARGSMVRATEASVRAGRGIEGDRYFAGRGTFSNPHARGNDLTLIEAEVLDALAGPLSSLAPEEARRNIVTRSIDLNALVGRRFLVGEVECVGQRLCEPCAHLQRLTAPGILRALVHRGGLRADALSDGVVRVGDEIAPA